MIELFKHKKLRWLSIIAIFFVVSACSESEEKTQIVPDPVDNSMEEVEEETETPIEEEEQEEEVEEEPIEEPVVYVSSQGTLFNSAITGIKYTCLPSASTGLVGDSGWSCQELEETIATDRKVQFSIGDIALGSATPTNISSIQLSDLFDLSNDTNQQYLQTIFRIVLGLSDDVGGMIYSINPEVSNILTNEVFTSNPIEAAEIAANAGVVLASSLDTQVFIAHHKLGLTSTEIANAGFITLHRQAEIVNENEEVYYKGTAQAAYLKPVLADKRPIIFLMDDRLSADLYLNTHDMRDGWATIAAKSGYPAYIFHPRMAHISGLPRQFDSLSRSEIDDNFWQYFGLGESINLPYEASSVASDETSLTRLYSHTMVRADSSSLLDNENSLHELIDSIVTDYGVSPVIVAQGNSAGHLLQLNSVMAAVNGVIAVEASECESDGEVNVSEVHTTFISTSSPTEGCNEYLLAYQQAGLGELVTIDAIGDSVASKLPMLDSNNKHTFEFLIANTQIDFSIENIVTVDQREFSTIGHYYVDYIGGKLKSGQLVGASRIQWIIPNNVTAEPVILYPGLNFSASVFMSTVDNRDGWAQTLAEHGHPVILYDPVDTSPSGIETSVTSLSGWDLGDVWTRFSDAIDYDSETNIGIPFEDTQFPYSAVEGFYPMMVGVGGRNGSNSDNFTQLLSTVAESYGRVIVAGHSKGSEVAFSVAGEYPNLVAGLVALEPTQCDTYNTDREKPSNTLAAHEIGPFLAIYGDYISARRQTGRFVDCTHTVINVANAGLGSRFISLPGDDFTMNSSPALIGPGHTNYQVGFNTSNEPIIGNTHMYMSDLNSKDIALEIVRFFSEP